MAAEPYGPLGSDRAGAPRESSTLAEPMAWLASRATSLVRELVAASGRRKAQPYLANLGIPLALIASFLAMPGLVPALIACGWWWAPREQRWEWLVVAGRGLVGTEWALLGVNLLAAYPDYRLVGGYMEFPRFDGHLSAGRVARSVERNGVHAGSVFEGVP
jgi:hypothetical protein